MQVVTADETHRLLDYSGLVEALRELVRSGRVADVTLPW